MTVTAPMSSSNVTVRPEVPAAEGAAPAGGWPRITVVTPSYNQGLYLEETLNSVLSQGYPNLQYIVMDGGSTDQSVEILRKHERHLAYWCSQKDRGQAHAINRGFARADGQIWAYLNSDDRYAPGALKRMAEEFVAGHEWVVGAVRNFGEGQADTITVYEPERGPEDWVKWFFENPIHQPGAFWSARLGRAYGPFMQTLHYVFDFEFFLRLRFQANLQPVGLPEVVAEFRVHPASKTMSQQSKFAGEFEECRHTLLWNRPDLAAAVGRRKRWVAADKLQVQALSDGGRGQRARALGELLASVRVCPRMAWERRTAGALRRILAGARDPG